MVNMFAISEMRKSNIKRWTTVVRALLIFTLVNVCFFVGLQRETTQRWQKFNLPFTAIHKPCGNHTLTHILLCIQYEILPTVSCWNESSLCMGKAVRWDARIAFEIDKIAWTIRHNRRNQSIFDETVVWVFILSFVIVCFWFEQTNRSKILNVSDFNRNKLFAHEILCVYTKRSLKIVYTSTELFNKLWLWISVLIIPISF